VPISYHFHGCKALLRFGKRRYTKHQGLPFYEKFAVFDQLDIGRLIETRMASLPMTLYDLEV